MNFWTHAIEKPDADVTVLVITENDERTMAYWDGETWLTADSEVPLSGDVTHWATLEDLPSSEDCAAELQRHAREQDRLVAQIEELENYDSCEGCNARTYQTICHCSGCGDLVAEKALVKMEAGRWLCPVCAALLIKEASS